MAKKPKTRADKGPEPKPSERDEPLKIDLDPEAAVKGLLKVEPEPRDSDEAPPHGDPLT